MLSAFESALLDRHLRGCPSCRAFAVDADQQTTLLRGAALELPTRRVQIPAAPARVLPRRIAGVLSAGLVAAAAATAVLWPGARPGGSGPAVSSARVGAPVLMVESAQPSLANVNVVVPRLKMQPASIADGPVHGYFSTPV